MENLELDPLFLQVTLLFMHMGITQQGSVHLRYARSSKGDRLFLLKMSLKLVPVFVMHFSPAFLSTVVSVSWLFDNGALDSG